MYRGCPFLLLDIHIGYGMGTVIENPSVNFVFLCPEALEGCM